MKWLYSRRIWGVIRINCVIGLCRSKIGANVYYSVCMHVVVCMHVYTRTYMYVSVYGTHHVLSAVCVTTGQVLSS